MFDADFKFKFQNWTLKGTGSYGGSDDDDDDDGGDYDDDDGDDDGVASRTNPVRLASGWLPS